MTQLTQPISNDDHIQGAADAPIILVLYGDYQCPYTRRGMTHIKATQRRFGNQLTFVYRHFPAPEEIHPYARPATQAALAANAQGKFWELHNLLFRNQTALTNIDLQQYAAQLGLDLERFNQDLKEHRHNDRMWRDLHGGWDSGVRSAPTLFINNVQYEGEPTLAGLVAAIEGVLETAV